MKTLVSSLIGGGVFSLRGRISSFEFPGINGDKMKLGHKYQMKVNRITIKLT